MGGGLILMMWHATQRVTTGGDLWCPALEEQVGGWVALEVWLLCSPELLGSVALGFCHRHP